MAEKFRVAFIFDFSARFVFVQAEEIGVRIDPSPTVSPVFEAVLQTGYFLVVRCGDQGYFVAVYNPAAGSVASAEISRHLIGIQYLFAAQIRSREYVDGTIHHSVVRTFEDIFALFDGCVPILFPHGDLGPYMFYRGFRPASVIEAYVRAVRNPREHFDSIVQVFLYHFEELFLCGGLVLPVIRIVDRRGLQIQVKTFEPFPKFEIGPAPECFRFCPCLFYFRIVHVHSFCSCDDFVGFADDLVMLVPDRLDVAACRSEIVQTGESRSRTSPENHDVG